MPVWAWILIWSVLVVALLGMLAWFAWRLFRKLMRTFAALEDLTAQVATLDLDSAPETMRFRPAIFQHRRELADAVAVARIQRAHRRALRRDQRVRRGKLLQRSPYKPED